MLAAGERLVPQRRPLRPVGRRFNRTVGLWTSTIPGPTTALPGAIPGRGPGGARSPHHNTDPRPPCSTTATRKGLPGGQTPYPVAVGGEGGIRTRDPLRGTRFPIVRTRPTMRPLPRLTGAIITSPTGERHRARTGGDLWARHCPGRQPPARPPGVAARDTSQAARVWPGGFQPVGASGHQPTAAPSFRGSLPPMKTSPSLTITWPPPN